jgi:hypothetical protein
MSYCKSTLPNREFDARKPFVCPGCSTPLRLAPWYVHLTEISALALDLGLCLLFGLRGVALFVVAILGWFPVGVIWSYFLGRIFPTKFERWSESPFTKLDLK